MFWFAVRDRLAVFSAVVNRPQYQIMVDRPKNKLDTLEVRVEASPALWAGGPEAAARAQKQVTAKLHDMLGLSIAVKVLAPNSIPRSEGKAKRIVDTRELAA